MLESGVIIHTIIHVQNYNTIDFSWCTIWGKCNAICTCSCDTQYICETIAFFLWQYILIAIWCWYWLNSFTCRMEYVMVNYGLEHSQVNASTESALNTYCVSTKYQKWEKTTMFIQFLISGTNVTIIAILRYSLRLSHCTISLSKYLNFAIACCSLSTVTTINYHLCHSLYARCITGRLANSWIHFIIYQS